MRIRTIKPGFWSNENLAAMPPLARLLFQGLWCLADREGRLEDRPARIKHEVLGYDDCDVNALLAQLHSAGFIVRYKANEKAYIAIPTFSKHQRPNNKELNSEIPAPTSLDLEQAALNPEFPTPPRLHSFPVPDLDLNSGSSPDLVSSPNCSGNSTDNACAREADLGPLLIESIADVRKASNDGFEEFWAAYVRKVAKADAQRAWRKLKPTEELRSKILDDVRRFESCDPQFIPYPASYLNGKRWQDEPVALSRAGPELPHLTPTGAFLVREYQKATGMQFGSNGDNSASGAYSRPVVPTTGRRVDDTGGSAPVGRPQLQRLHGRTGPPD